MGNSEKLLAKKEAAAAKAAAAKDAAALHYASISRPLDAREVCESEDGAAGVLRDAATEKLRGRGFSARDAALAVDAVMAVFAERDRQACAQVLDGAGLAAAENILAKAEAREALRVMAIKLVQAPKPRFSAGCFLLASGMEYEGITSERDWAERQGLSHTHASNEVLAWQRTMKLGKTSAQKSEAACNAYRDTNGRTAKAKL